MSKNQEGKDDQSSPASAKNPTPTNDAIIHLAFNHSLQANIITTVSTGRIIMANSAACELLGYTEKEILKRIRADIFDINKAGFKKMLKQRTAEGQSKASITAVKKTGEGIICEVTSAVFKDKRGIEKAITTIVDVSERIRKQKDIDIAREKVVADDIILAESKQKTIDAKKEKIVAGNIIIAQEKADARLVENNEWIKYIAKASYDVMWDWDIVTGEIYVGESIKEVFGYVVDNNTAVFPDFLHCLMPEEKERIEKKMQGALSSRNKSWKDTYMFRRKDGSVAITTSRASIIRDEEGKAIRLIGAIQDISRVQELERKLEDELVVQEKQSEIFNLAAKLSFDGIWDWNILTNEFFFGEGFEEMFGYSHNSSGNKGFKWADHVHPGDKKAVEKGMLEAVASSSTRWEYAYRSIKSNGPGADVFGRASVMRDKNGIAYRMIGVIHDLREQRELEGRLDDEITKSKLLTESKDSFKLIFNSSSDILYDIDLIANKIVLSDAYEKDFGYKITGNMTPVSDWADHIHADDKEAVILDYFRMLATDDIKWKYTYRFLRADNSVANVLSSAIILRDAGGEAYRMIGSMQDISKQRVLEEKLRLEIKLKEQQILDATKEAKETERSDIGRELHDNVNQLLSASKLYVDMAKRGGENSDMYLTRSSEYTLSAIEEIRKLTKELTTDAIKNLGLCESISSLAEDTMELNQVKILCDFNFIEDSVSEKFKVNLFRIVQEQLQNILKHANAKSVAIKLSQDNGDAILSISDDGIGFDIYKDYNGIGLINIKSRATAYHGIAEFISQPGKGCVLNVSFPVTGKLAASQVANSSL